MYFGIYTKFFAICIASNATTTWCASFCKHYFSLESILQVALTQFFINPCRFDVSSWIYFYRCFPAPYLVSIQFLSWTVAHLHSFGMPLFRCAMHVLQLNYVFSKGDCDWDYVSIVFSTNYLFCTSSFHYLFRNINRKKGGKQIEVFLLFNYFHHCGEKYTFSVPSNSVEEMM